MALAAIAAALSSTPTTDAATAIGCGRSPAPLLCSVKAFHARTNHYRQLTNHSRLALVLGPYPKRRLFLAWLWSRRKVQARTAYIRWQRAPWLHGSWYQAALCVHAGEGAWSSETGNGFHGGMQMDGSFEAAYGPEYLSRYGNAGYWPPADQLHAAYRAWLSRGWTPWPATAAACGLL